MPLLGRKADLDTPCSIKPQAKAEDVGETFNLDSLDGLTDQERLDRSDAEEHKEVLAALDKLFADNDDDNVASETSGSSGPAWLDEVRALAQKHGPFSAEQISQIVHELAAVR